MGKKNLTENFDDDFSEEGKKHGRALQYEFVEDESLTGDMASLESDDNTLENAHDMGLYRNDKGDNPQELDLGGQIQKAENNRRGMD